MNRIVLIGNGFDLAHGLPTRYEDFINDYWKYIFNNALNSTSLFEQDCIKIEISDPEYNLRKVLEDGVDFAFTNIDEIIKAHNRYRIYQPIKFTVDNKLLKHISDKSKFKSWVDIENEYYSFLCDRFNDSTSNTYYYNTIEALNNHFEYIKLRLKDYLIDIYSKNKIQISKKIRDIIYSSFFVGDFKESIKHDLILDEYHKIENSKPNVSVPSASKLSQKTISLLNEKPEIDFEFLNIMSNDRNFWEKYFEVKPKDCMFLNFNYTNTTNIYIDLKNKEINGYIPLVINIHGELNNPANPIIFGYGDELEENYSKLENLNDNAYLENIKSINYQETDNYKRMLSFINSDKYQVIILGHSCGNSDRTLLNTLFEHENCVSIKPYYYQYKDDKGEIKDNYSDIVRNISRSFKDKKSMRDKVVNKTYTTWFSQKLN